jgi:hypothetical protein
MSRLYLVAGAALLSTQYVWMRSQVQAVNKERVKDLKYFESRLLSHRKLVSGMVVDDQESQLQTIEDDLLWVRREYTLLHRA